MKNSYIFFLYIITFTACAIASYLDIPDPPQRPIRFKTRKQIEDYLKAVKDYYAAFKIKLVRRSHFLPDYYSNIDGGFNSVNQPEETEKHAGSSDNIIHYRTYQHQQPILSKIISFQLNPYIFLRTGEGIKPRRLRRRSSLFSE
ncbi:unnamed protein product [Didymodactylos carnosus]|uniref:Uncharacterized protein n=1 Tax=Didymodactylos carnosus TaxID=1234261 RepID=A0A814EWS0_9BILA|nr:unnamed protein product [Didymodactylos carnosus]CAF3746524.1 unnamed protein product [Didymodactylos carnosus]